MKAETENLDTAKLTNVSTIFDDLKARVDDLDVAKLKTLDLKKLSNVVHNVVKHIKLNKLKTKVNNLEMKILDKTTLIHINQCNTI